eukprot:m.28080 g.28080  ORF g.28080 m.28080 type:complete len:587 (-) comp10375_c0_seq2:20-1780(-)
MATLECAAVVVYLDQYGQQRKRCSSKKPAALQFGRDANRIPTIIITYDHTELAFTAQGHVRILGPNIADGKASVCLDEQGIQIYISRASPETLKKLLLSFMQQLRETVQERKLTEESEQRISLKPLPKVRKPLGAIQLNPDPSSPPMKQSKPMQNKSIETSNLQRPTAAMRSMLRTRPMTELNEEQQAILMQVLAGKSVFFTGSAGTGKSFLIKKILEALPKDTTVATASTGVAACAIGGTTLHAFAGVQMGSNRLPLKTSAWIKAKVLLIDEISMVDARYFDQLEEVARKVRRSRQPFGGIQLVLVGDFLQLPPITRTGGKTQFCFNAKSWESCVDAFYHLTKVHRQTDQQFIAMLHRFRLGKCTQEDEQYIRATAGQMVELHGIRATRLCTHVKEAEVINQKELALIAEPSKVFRRHDSSPDVKTSGLAHRVDEEVILKVGAQVMLTTNINVMAGLANGSRGVVKKFDATGWPVVKFLNGHEETIRPHVWRAHSASRHVYECRQLPLKLAWAVSIHKSQGMTLDALEVDLSRVFEYGQAYVALSRARSYQGLCVKGFDASSIKAHPQVLTYYEKHFAHCLTEKN